MSRTGHPVVIFPPQFPCKEYRSADNSNYVLIFIVYFVERRDFCLNCCKCGSFHALIIWLTRFNAVHLKVETGPERARFGHIGLSDSPIPSPHSHGTLMSRRTLALTGGAGNRARRPRGAIHCSPMACVKRTGRTRYGPSASLRTVQGRAYQLTCRPARPPTLLSLPRRPNESSRTVNPTRPLKAQRSP